MSWAEAWDIVTQETYTGAMVMVSATLSSNQRGSPIVVLMRGRVFTGETREGVVSG